MFYAATQRLELTKSLDRANELLNAGWLLLRASQDGNDQFIFLLGRHRYTRKKALADSRARIEAAETVEVNLDDLEQRK